MNIRTSPALRTALTLTALTTIAACATAPLSNARLDQARTAYDQAAADPQVARAAPVELQAAQRALASAQEALGRGEQTDVEHFAYLAQRRTETALQANKIAQAEQAVAQSKLQRDRILLSARTREADVASAHADEARTAADTARGDSEVARSAADQSRLSAEAATRRAGSLEAQLAELKARPTERGMVLTLGDVLFDSGQSNLKPGALRTVDQLAGFLTKNPTRKVSIEGHTDSQGSDEYNQALSSRRSDNVRLALIARHVPADQITSSGEGEGFPVASNDNAAGRLQNRRVEVVFSDDNGTIAPRRR